jgi:ribosomal protein L3 glutamine methyltransferase
LTVGDLIHDGAARLRKARLAFAHGTTDPVAEAAFLAGEALGIAPDRIERRAGERVSLAQVRKVRALIGRRIRTRKPGAYLVRKIYLRGVPFRIDERAIVPRSYLGEILDGDELEILLGRGAGDVRHVLDLCTGSACLAILAARRFPNATIDAVDLSSPALALAKVNVADHRLKSRVRLLRGDLFGPIETRRYDLIIANPPYVDARGMARLPAECRHEPSLALDGGTDGLAVVRRIVDGARRHLTTRGGLLCEVGRGRKRLERAYPDAPFLWLDTEASSGEVFWLDTAALR